MNASPGSAPTPVRIRHLWLAVALLPGLLRSREQRALLRDMRALIRRLPHLLEAPLPEAMHTLTPPSASLPLPEDTVRRLADLAALLERNTGLGFCLRRSLVRYHFLRRGGLSLQVHFGARFKEDERERAIAGHAWVCLDGQPYYEADENWRNYRVVYRWPQND